MAKAFVIPRSGFGHGVARAAITAQALVYEMRDFVAIELPDPGV